MTAEPAPSRTTEPAARVVYVVGSGRSGSTLLERMLGAVPGFVNVGELIDVFRRVVAGDELCGCGEPFSRCPFWTAVGDRAFGGWTTALVEEAAGLQRSVARQRHLARLLVPATADATFRRRLTRYGDIYGRLYAAVLAESGARVVVDASKGAAQAVAVSRSPATSLQLVHLVRDVRGVAFSWAKSDVARPHGGVPGATMARHRPQLTAARWSGLQAEIEVARRCVDGSAMLRYEDLVRDPQGQVVRLLRRLRLVDELPSLDHIDGPVVHLGASHGLSGNPSRFRLGRQELRLDEQWRGEMSRWDRLSTSLIAGPALGRYGYLPRTRGGSS